MPTCRLIVAPTSPAAAMTAPPVMSECPLRYLVVEWITRSAPSAMGCCRYGEAKVLSTTSSAPARCARSATAAISVTFSSGFDGVSVHTSAVSGRIAAATASRSPMSTAV